tara:strand:+ start:144 stop:308 length:165 start_codon:yes stop_codon:yes gene_type:complete
MADYTFKSTMTDINYFHNETVSEKAIFLIPEGWSYCRSWSEYIQGCEKIDKSYV